MVRRTQFLIKATATGLALLLAAGCSQVARYDGASKVARNEVHLVRLSHALPGGKDFSSGDRASLSTFLSDIGAGYGDTISLVAAPDYPADAAAAVADVLRDNGLMLSAPPATPPQTPSPGGALLIVDRFIVTPPQCPNTVMHATRNYMNAESPQFGCANVINLGQMVANPRDLLSGAGDAPANTEKAAQGIRLWREDTPAFVAPQNTKSGSSGFGGSGGGGSSGGN